MAAPLVPALPEEQAVLSQSSTAHPQPPTSSTRTTTTQTVHIGSRRSELALLQTEIVEQALRKQWPQHDYEVHAMSTMGDKNQTTALHNFGAKSLWTHELEAKLIAGELDCIVHSLKDIPTQLPPSCKLGAIMARDDPRDALVLKASLASQYQTLASLPPGSVIGTSSVRRSAQIARKYPHLKFADVRGNVNTRMAKLDAEDGVYAGLVLAAAGMRRMGWAPRITQYLDWRGAGVMYAVGQGALGVEIRDGDEVMERLLAPLVDERAAWACLAERSVMRALEGGCSVPIGVETEWVGEKLVMRACVISLDGSEAVDGEKDAAVTGTAQAEEYGLEMARLLVEKGAQKILEKINLNRSIVQAQDGG